MNCIICNNDCTFFLKKEFEGIFKKMIPVTEYFKCKNCGFTFSPTIFELNEEEFFKLNKAFHEYAENSLIEKNVNQSPYIEQATMLNILKINDLIDMSNALDFAGGYGTLNKILKKYFKDISFLIYEPYMQDPNIFEYVIKDNLKQYNTVFNSAIFEQITVSLL